MAKEKEPKDVSGPYEALLYWIANLRKVATGKSDEDHLRWSTQYVVQRGVPAQFAAEALGAAGTAATDLAVSCKSCNETASFVAQETLDSYTSAGKKQTSKTRKRK